MSFKIVQTVESGQNKLSLCIIPTAWESDSILRWPSTKRIGLLNKLVHDKNSVPDEDWLKQSCVRKRSDFTTYEAARKELDFMLEMSDSDANMKIPPKKRLKTAAARKQIGRLPQTNFNEIMEQYSKKLTSPQQQHNIVVVSQEIKECQEVATTPTKETTSTTTKQIRQITTTPCDLNYYNFLQPPQPGTSFSGNEIQQTATQRPQLLNCYNFVQSSPTKAAATPTTTANIRQIALRRPKLRIESQPHQMLNPQQHIFVLNNNGEVDTSCTTLIKERELFQEMEETEVNLDGVNLNLPQTLNGFDESELTTILSNQEILLTNQQVLKSNQIKILEQLAKNNVMLDLLLSRLDKDNNNSLSTTIEPSRCIDTAKINDLLPVDSFDKLEKLELAMADEILMQAMVEEKSSICGTSGKMNGINCCYALIDNFFSREFLKSFSWSGGSRENSAKSSFKTHKNIIKVFYTIIRKADLEFSEIACEKFLKSIVKNAKRRADLLTLSKLNCRASRGKQRPTNLVYKKNVIINNSCAGDSDNLYENVHLESEFEREIILETNEIPNNAIEPEDASTMHME